MDLLLSITSMRLDYDVFCYDTVYDAHEDDSGSRALEGGR
jgi:hypothetical protein